MTTTNWLEILQTTETELAITELQNIAEKTRALYKALEPVCKQETKDTRPIKSDCNYETTYLQQRRIMPERYYSLAVGIVRIEVRKSRQKYYVRMCNWKPKGRKMIEAQGWNRTAHYEDLKNAIEMFEYLTQEFFKDEDRENVFETLV